MGESSSYQVNSDIPVSWYGNINIPGSKVEFNIVSSTASSGSIPVQESHCGLDFLWVGQNNVDFRTIYTQNITRGILCPTYFSNKFFNYMQWPLYHIVAPLKTNGVATSEDSISTLGYSSNVDCDGRPLLATGDNRVVGTFEQASNAISNLEPFGGTSMISVSDSNLEYEITYRLCKK